MIFAILGIVSALVVWGIATVGLPGLFVLMAVESFGIPPVPSEVILPFAGFLVADGAFSFPEASLVALTGGLVGSYAAYAVGRWWRHRITGVGIGRLRLEPQHLERADVYFTRHGESTVGIARMMPVIRSYISYPAGSARMDPRRFGVYTLLGSIPFTLVLVYAGMVLRSSWRLVSSDLQYLNYPIIAVVVSIVVLLALQALGWLEPGWPPRRKPRTVLGSPE